MISYRSLDSTGTFADAEDARLQFVIVRQHVVVETDNSLVFTDLATFQLLENGAEKFPANRVLRFHSWRFFAAL